MCEASIDVPDDRNSVFGHWFIEVNLGSSKVFIELVLTCILYMHIDCLTKRIIRDTGYTIH